MKPKPNKIEMALHREDDVQGVKQFRERCGLSLTEAMRIMEKVTGHIPPGRPGARRTSMRSARKDYRKMVKALGTRVVWALKFLDTKGGGLVFDPRDLTSCQRWEDWFMDALDEAGYVVDRKSFFNKKYGKGGKGSKRRRAAA